MKSKTIYSNYESLGVRIEEIWEVVILGTYGGCTRVEFSLTEDLKTAKSIAKEYKEKLENCQEVIVALVGLTNGKREELFGRIVYRKGDDGIVETKSN